MMGTNKKNGVSKMSLRKCLRGYEMKGRVNLCPGVLRCVFVKVKAERLKGRVGRDRDEIADNGT